MHGRAANGAAFYNCFIKAQRELRISPIHDLYSTKDTYISVCLSGSEPVNLSRLSEQTGVSESTIKKHYGRFMHHPDRDAIELRKIRPPALPEELLYQTSPAPDGERAPASTRGAMRRGSVVREGSVRRASGKKGTFGPRLAVARAKRDVTPQEMAEMDGSRIQHRP